MSSIPTPISTLAAGDPGDDVSRRFAYQWSITAILACSTFDDTLDVVEIYCEHHEDALLKHRDTTFTGVQIKTRELGGDLFTATEEVILSALTRFIQLEQQFPGQMRAFVIATNHSFLSGRETGTCLPHLMSLAAIAGDETSADAKLQTFLKRLSRRANAPTSLCLAMLKKTKCDHSYPKLDHIKKHVASTLSERWPGAEHASVTVVSAAAEALISECQRAASLDHAQSLPVYVRSLTTAVELQRATIAGKRIDKARLEQLLATAIASPSLLTPSTPVRPSVSPSKTLDAKLTGGGFSVVSLNAAKDLFDAAEYRSLEWITKYGDKQGLERHSHIRTFVLSECAAAFEQARTSAAPFGIAMQGILRERFRARRAQRNANVFDLTDEHLEGHAYSLTRDCKVWWSDPFPLPGDA